MANERKITEIIDPQAWEQFDRLNQELSTSQNNFLQLVKVVANFNSEVGKSGNFKDLSDTMEKVSQSNNDLTKNTDELTQRYRKLREQQSELIRSTEENAKAQNQAGNEFVGFNKALDETAKRQAQLTLTHKQLSAEIRRLQKEIDKSGDSTGRLSEDLAELTQRDALVNEQLKETSLELRRRAKIENEAEDSSKRLALILDQLRADYNKLTQEEKDNVDIGGKMREEIMKLDAQLKESDASIGVFSRNVGNYTAASGELVDVLTQMFPQLSLVTGAYKKGESALTGITTAVKSYVAGSKSATAATNAGSKSLKLLRIAIASTGIGLLIVALGSLVAYFTSTQEGIDKVTRVTRPLGAAFKQLQVIGASVGKALVDAFTSPRKALKKLVEFAKNPFKAIREGAKSVGNSLKEGFELGSQKDKLIKEIEEIEIAQTTLMGRLKRDIQEQRNLARDTTLTEAQRREAAAKAVELINQQEEERNKLVQKRIDLVKLQQKIDGEANQESRKELAELQAEQDENAARAEQLRGRVERSDNRVAKSMQKNAKDTADETRKLTERQEELLQKLNQIDDAQNKTQAGLFRQQAEDERLSFDDRLHALQDFANKSQEIIDNQYAEDARRAELKYADDQEMLDAELALIAQKRLEAGQKVADDVANVQKSILSGITDDALEESFKKQRQSLEDSFLNQEITLKEFNERKKELQDEYDEQRVQSEIDTVQELIEVNKGLGLDVYDEELALEALRDKLRESRINKAKEDAKQKEKDREKDLEEEKKLTEAKKELFKELGSLAMSLIQNRLDKQMEELEQSKQVIQERLEDRLNEIDATAESEDEARQQKAVAQAQSAAEERKIDRKQRELKQKQARFDRLNQIGNIIGNTAVAVAAALPNIPLSITVGAIGAAQLAQVLAQPLPKFATGTDSSPEGWAITGEKGRELMISPSGQVGLSGSTDTLTYLQKGTKVIPADETKRILASRSLSSGKDREGGTTFDLMMWAKESERQNKMLMNTIKNKRNPTTILTKRGLRFEHRRNRNFEKRIKNLL